MTRIKVNLENKVLTLLKSRKFWATAGTITVVVLNDILELQIDPDTIYALVGSIGSLVIGLAIVDAAGK